VAAEAGAVSSAELSSLPTCPLTPSQLGDLELLLAGAYAPLTGFMTDADARSAARCWQLTDGTPFPVAITLDVPPIDEAADRVLLADPEGTPIAVMTISERTSPAAGLVRLAGPVSANRPPEHGPFRRLMLTPAEARAQLEDGPVLAFATRGPLGYRQIGQLRHHAGQRAAPARPRAMSAR
jgi:sulfate adenylyltransferase